MAITNTVFAERIEVTKRNRRSGDTIGRLKDTLWMLMLKLRLTAGVGVGRQDTMFFSVVFGNRRQALKAIIGGGDNGELTITIMFQDED